jgi:hypothetical protein
MSLTNAAEMSLTFTHKAQADAPPADPFINNTRFYDVGVGSPVPPFCADLRIEAKGRDLSEQRTNGANTTQDDPDEPPQGGTGYVLDVYRTDVSPHVLIYRRSGIPHVGDQASPEGIQWNVAASEYMIDSGSPGPVKDYRVEFYSRKLGVDSQAWATDPFVVTGYGLDYGENYGGCDTAGVNLAQGDPPIAVEPTPGSGNLRRWLLDFTGTPGSLDDHRLQSFYFDALGGTSAFFNIDIDGSLYATAEEVAEFVAGELSATLPATFSVDRVGGEIIVSTQFGNFSTNRAITSGFTGGFFPYGVSLQEEQSAAQNAAVGAIYGLDFYDTQNINGQPTDVLGPNASASYTQTNGSFVKELRVQGITYDKRKELDFQAKTATLFVTQSVTIGNVVATTAFSQDFEAALNNSSLSDYLTNVGNVGPASAPVDRVPQRNSVTGVTLEKNLAAYAGGQTYQSSEDQAPSQPYRLVWKEHYIPRVDAPSGLPRTYWLTPSVPSGVSGLTIEVEYNGSIIATETVGSPANATESARIRTSLASQVDANGFLSSEVLEAFPRVEVRGGNNFNYDLDLYVGNGLRIKFEEI